MNAVLNILENHDQNRDKNTRKCETMHRELNWLKILDDHRDKGGVRVYVKDAFDEIEVDLYLIGYQISGDYQFSCKDMVWKYCRLHESVAIKEEWYI